MFSLVWDQQTLYDVRPHTTNYDDELDKTNLEKMSCKNFMKMLFGINETTWSMGKLTKDARISLREVPQHK
jgi:hypothetical protein